jgi:hypothetical protein
VGRQAVIVCLRAAEAAFVLLIVVLAVLAWVL